MKYYFTTACIAIFLVISLLSFIKTTSAYHEPDAVFDSRINSAVINCVGGETEAGYFNCVYLRSVYLSPEESVGHNVIDSIIPSSARLGGSLQHSGGSTCTFSNDPHGCVWNAYISIFLTPGIPITHVVRIGAENDPNPSNNVFIETFIINPNGEITIILHSENKLFTYNNYYNNYYNNGYDNGYNNGYLAPFDMVSNNYNNGYNNGYNNNYNNGYNNGYIKPVE